MWGVLGALVGGITQLLPGSPMWRQISHEQNNLVPNEVMDTSSAIFLRRIGIIDDGSYKSELRNIGIDAFKADQLLHTYDKYPDVSNLLEMRQRGLIPEAIYQDRMSKQGFDDTDIKLLTGLTEQKLQAGEIITAWRRGIFSETSGHNYFNDLRHQGWSDDRIDLLKQVYEFFPSAQDLITFAVREVYTPEIREKFGMDEDLPEIFITEAKKAGLPEDQAKNYWASHWALPSPLQGFEMLHRGVINEEELNLLLKSLDLMPFWRDKLTDISYNPLTRVDVRRMHKLGILNREAVKKAYGDIGYNDDNAELMTKFTIDYNDGSPVSEETKTEKEKEDLKGLTKANIISAYKDRLIVRDDAESYLKRIKIAPEVVRILLSQADFDVDETLDKLKISTVEKHFVNGVITYNEAVDELGKLDILPERQEMLLTTWIEKVNNKLEQPSKTDLMSFVKSKIITEDEFRSEMRSLGYAHRYVNMYVQSLSKK